MIIVIHTITKSSFYVHNAYKKNIGKGYAVIQGIRKSTYPWILTCDFDMSVLPSTYTDWLAKNYIVKNTIVNLSNKRSKVKQSMNLRKAYLIIGWHSFLFL